MAFVKSAYFYVMSFGFVLMTLWTRSLGESNYTKLNFMQMSRSKKENNLPQSLKFNATQILDDLLVDYDPNVRPDGKSKVSLLCFFFRTK